MIPGLLQQVGLTIDEQLPTGKDGQLNPLYPHDGRCKAGHQTSPKTRFFRISGSALAKQHWGVYCASCVTAAKILADKKKQGKLSDDPVLEELIQQAERSVKCQTK